MVVGIGGFALTAHRSTYLELHSTRTPSYGGGIRPAGWLPGTVVVLALALVSSLILAPDAVAGWVDSALASLR